MNPPALRPLRSSARSSTQPTTTLLGTSQQPFPTIFQLHCTYKALSIVAAIVLAIIIVLGLRGSITYAQRSVVHFTVCTSESCRIYSSLLSRSINESEDPCDNFYQYVCAGWKTQHAQTSVYKEHMKYFVNAVAKTMRRVQVPRHGQTAVHQAAAIYQRCAAIVTEGKEELDEFLAVLHSVGIYWPRIPENANAIAVMIQTYTTLQISPLFTIRKNLDAGNVVVEMLPSSSLAKMIEKRKELEGYGKYRDYFQSFVDIFGSINSHEPVTLSYLSFLSLEDTVFRHMAKHALTTTLSLYTVADIMRLTPNIKPVRIFPEINEGLNISKNTPYLVYLGNPKYLDGLDKLYASIGESNVHMYISWVVIQHLAPFMSKDLAVLYYGSIHEALEETPARCLSLAETFLGSCIFAKYMAEELSQAVIADINVIAQNIRETLTAKVITDSFLGLPRSFIVFVQDQGLLFRNTTADTINSRIEDIGPLLARSWVSAAKATYIDRLSYSTSDNRQILRIVDHTTYNFFDDNTHILAVAPYVSMLPLYESDILDGVKYGGLGIIIGAAYFDQFVANVSSTTNIENELHNRRQCYGSGGESLSSTNSLYSRAVSLEVVWDAFWKSRVLRSDHRIKGLLHLSEEKLLFATMCYALCSNVASEAAEELCNGPLRHDSIFSALYSCSERSPMKGQRCKVL
ncbi:endothelin-converting enzyme 1-like [Ornithodoros turicata]|uniref:endothelin-converting enzyme 1-like n=1 Tax=Ornithodoros turicata TaxID=34597 RepID=UPI00313A042E